MTIKPEWSRIEVWIKKLKVALVDLSTQLKLKKMQRWDHKNRLIDRYNSRKIEKKVKRYDFICAEIKQKT